MKIRNWDKWQSYRKDRGQPPWIKVHRALMRDPNWVSLNDAQRGQLVAIWMLAADRNGVIPASASLIKKLCHMDKEPDLNLFIQCGFLERGQDDANATPDRRQHDQPEESRGETETEESRKTGKIFLPDNWSVSADHYELAKKLGLSTDAVSDAAAEMRAWSLGNGEKRRDWDHVFNNWLRRNAKNGQRRSGTFHDDSRSLTKAADKLIEQAKRGEFSFGPRPGLPPEPSATVIQLLPKGRGDGT